MLHVDIRFASIARILLALAAVWLIGRLLPVVLVLVAALFIGGTLSPVIAWLETRGIWRGVAITLVFGLLLIATVLIIGLTIPELFSQAKELQAQEPVWRARLVEWIARSPLGLPVANGLRDLQIASWVNLSPTTALAFSARIGEFLAYSMAAIFLALYGLIDRDRLRGMLFAIVPRERHMRLSRIMLSLETIVGGYIRGQLLTSTLMAVFMFVLLTACGVPSALALAVIGGAADVLPYIGPFLTIGPAVIASIQQGPLTVGVVLILMLVYEEFESRVLIPVVYGRALRLPSTVVIVALLVGATLMGVVGALLALPVAAALVMLMEELRFELPGEPVPAVGNRRRKDDEHGNWLYHDLTRGMPAEQAAAIAVEQADERKKDDADAVLAGAEHPSGVSQTGQKDPPS